MKSMTKLAWLSTQSQTLTEDFWTYIIEDDEDERLQTLNRHRSHRMCFYDGTRNTRLSLDLISIHEESISIHMPQCHSDQGMENKHQAIAAYPFADFIMQPLFMQVRDPVMEGGCEEVYDLQEHSLRGQILSKIELLSGK